MQNCCSSQKASGYFIRRWWWGYSRFSWAGSCSYWEESCWYSSPWHYCYSRKWRWPNWCKNLLKATLTNNQTLLRVTDILPHYYDEGYGQAWLARHTASRRTFRSAFRMTRRLVRTKMPMVFILADRLRPLMTLSLAEAFLPCHYIIGVTGASRISLDSWRVLLSVLGQHWPGRTLWQIR